MILRGNYNNERVLVTLTDHSQLVGQIAAHWGNENFAPPRPNESVVRAATYHDYGWLLYETSPLIDPVSHQPYSFLDVPMNRHQLDCYRWAQDWMAGIDRYAALLMNMHRTGLWQARYQTITHPTAHSIHNLSPLVHEFIATNEAQQNLMKRDYDGAELEFNYRLLQVWDLLGLYFCCGDVYPDYIDPVPVDCGAGGDGKVRLELIPEGLRRVRFEPYPFDARPFTIQLRFKLVPAGPFASDADFRKAYFGARHQWAEFELA
jgi:hypothetical protein